MGPGALPYAAHQESASPSRGAPKMVSAQEKGILGDASCDARQVQFPRPRQRNRRRYSLSSTRRTLVSPSSIARYSNTRNAIPCVTRKPSWHPVDRDQGASWLSNGSPEAGPVVAGGQEILARPSRDSTTHAVRTMQARYVDSLDVPRTTLRAGPCKA